MATERKRKRSRRRDVKSPFPARRIPTNFPRIAADSDGCSTVRLYGVADRVRTYGRTDVESTEYRRGRNTETMKKVRREYGNSTDMLFKYGRLRCSGGFTFSLLKLRQFKSTPRTKMWRKDDEPDDRECSGSDSGCSQDQCMASMRSSCMN